MSTTHDLEHKLTNFKGEVLKQGEEDVVLRDALITSIDAQLPGDDTVDSKTKVRMFRLGQKLAIEDTIELAAAEVELILNRAVKIYPPMVYGQLVEILDPAQFAD